MWRSRLSGKIIEEEWQVHKHKSYNPETDLWQFWENGKGVTAKGSRTECGNLHTVYGKDVADIR